MKHCQNSLSSSMSGLCLIWVTISNAATPSLDRIFITRPSRRGDTPLYPPFYGKGGHRGVEQQLFSLDDEERYRINVFDWEKEFLKIFPSPSRGEGQGEGGGGFDAVIGNPPYVRQELLGNLKSYLQSHYKVYHGVADLYSYFIERGVSLLKEDGIFSYIVANKWMRANYGEPLRTWMKQQCIEEIIDFGDLPVFLNATTYPCIIRISKKSSLSKQDNREFRAINVTTLKFDSLEAYVNGTVTL